MDCGGGFERVGDGFNKSGIKGELISYAGVFDCFKVLKLNFELISLQIINNIHEFRVRFKI